MRITRVDSGSILSVGGRPLSAASTRAVDTPGAIYLLLRTDAAAAVPEHARACAARVRSLASAHPHARARVSARPAHALRLRGVYQPSSVFRRRSA
ncbi:hypothetical protein QTP88_019269 [Uroleucon formosanum]